MINTSYEAAIAQASMFCGAPGCVELAHGADLCPDHEAMATADRLDEAREAAHSSDEPVRPAPAQPGGRKAVLFAPPVDAESFSVDTEKVRKALGIRVPMVEFWGPTVTFQRHKRAWKVEAEFTSAWNPEHGRALVSAIARQHSRMIVQMRRDSLTFYVNDRFFDRIPA